MMFNRFYNMEMMNTSASAPCTNAYSFCAHSADTAVISALDAIIMASIIIYALITLLGLRLIHVLAVLVLVAGLVRLVNRKTDTPWWFETAV